MILPIFLLIFLFSFKGSGEFVAEHFSKLNTAYLKYQCQSKNDVESCFVEKVKPLVYLYGSNFVINDLLYEIDRSDVLGSCHTLAHSVGKEIYKLNPESFSEYIYSTGDECEFGAAHGIIESLLSDSRVDLKNKEAIKKICGDDEKIDCNHIVGHFLLVWTNKDVGKALSMCDFLEKENQIYICYKGVFMEYITAQNLLEHDLINNDWFDKEATLQNLERLCNKHKNLAGISCWEELPHSIVSKFDSGLDKSFDYCNRAPNEISIKRCKNLVSSLITGKVLESEITFLTNN